MKLDNPLEILKQNLFEEDENMSLRLTRGPLQIKSWLKPWIHWSCLRRVWVQRLLGTSSGNNQTRNYEDTCFLWGDS